MLFTVSEGQPSHLEVNHIEGEVEDLSLRIVHTKFNGLVPVETNLWGKVGRRSYSLKMMYLITLLRSLIKETLFFLSDEGDITL